MASLYVDPTVMRAAERQGLLTFGLSDAILEVLSPPGFQPRAF